MKEFNLSGRKVFWGGSMFAIATLMIFSVAVFVSTKILYQNKIMKLQKSNQELVSILDGFATELQSLDAEMDELYEKDMALRTYADLPVIDSDVQKVGIGGSRLTEMANMDLLVPVDGTKPSDVNFNLNKLKREIELEKLSLTELQETIEKNSDFFKHMPSIRPTDGGYVSDGFGYRGDPFTKRRKLHKGIDIAGRRGTPVYATGDGVVRYARYYGGFGKAVKIDHGYGYTTAYAHLQKYFVKSGEKVTRGQIIGELGNTGRSTGPHLHYEVRISNKPVNPMSYFMQSEL